MKKIFVYKKWNFLVLLNNFVLRGKSVYKKNIVYLHFDVNKFFIWVYNKKVQLQNTKILSLKKRFKFN